MKNYNFNFKSSFYEKLKLLIIPMMLLTLGVGQMWAADVQKDAIIYMDNSVADWSYSNIYFVINNTNGYPMSAVANTKLYVHKRSANTWGGYSNVRFFAATGSWGGDDASMGSESNMVSYGANLTNTQTNYGFNGNNYYVIKLDKAGTKTSSSTRANLSTSYIGNAISSMNKTITVKAKVSTDGGSSYSEATSPGTLSASSNKFTTYNSCASATSLSSGTISCGYTATTTLTAADATGYDFVGWYNSSGTQQTTSKTLTIYPTANATYYAYYKEKRYSLTFSHNGHGSIAVGGSTVASGSTAYVNYSTTKTLVATPNTGYNFSGWTKSGSNTGSVTIGNASNASTTIKATNTGATITAGFTPKTTTITLNNQSATTAGTTEVTATYDAAMPDITLPEKDGYTFGGYWGAPGGSGPKYYNADGSSAQNWNNTESTYTLFAKWTENMSTVSLVASPTGKGSFTIGGDAATSTTAGVTTTRSVTAVPIAGYSFDSWSISGGASISSTSTNPTTVTGGGAGTAATLTATFVEDLTYYDVTFGVGTSYTSLGSLSATNNSTSSSISSGADLVSGTSVTFTASPNTGYTVEGWYTNAACTEGKHDAGSTTYTIASLSSDVTVYVKFVEKTWSVAFAAGTGGTVTTPNSTPRTVGQVTGISIAATPATGYTFNTWTITSGSGSFTSAATTNSNKFKPTAASTITASFNETMSSLSTSCHYDAGNPSYAAPAVTGSYTNVGYATTRTITATAAGTGYTFVGWTLTNCTRTDGGAATATSITIRSNGDGAAATVVANYEEDLTQDTWIIKGGSAFGGTAWSTEHALTKKTGHSTESVVYHTFEIASTNTGDYNANFNFKLVKKGASDTYYGIATVNHSSEWWYNRNSGEQTMSTGGGLHDNVQLRADVAGPYEVKIDYTDASNPTVTITFPTSYTLTYSIGSIAGNNGSISTSPSTASGSKVLSGNSVTLTAPAAKTGYTWKGWYTNAAGTEGKIADTDRAITVTMSADKTLYACYTEDMHTVTVTTDGHGTITTPTAPATTVSAGIATDASIATSASTGYTFYNWTKTSGSGTVTFANANANSTTVKATSDATVQANFVDQWNLKGDQWSSFGEYKPMTATANANEYNLSLSLTKGTKYQFKVVKRAYNGSAEGTTDTWYGTTDDAGNKVFARGGSSFTTVANGMNNNLEVTADVTGTYTFTISTSGSTPVITVTYPTAYTITYGVGAHNGSSTAVSVSPSFTSGDYVLPETDVTFSKGTTKTGYTWKGWYSKDDGTGTLHSSTDANLSWTATRTGNISVYACYNVVNYTITYNLNGGSNPGGAPTGFTIESSAITLPTPSKTGYTFNGWYENADLSTGGVKTTIPAGSTGNKVYYAKWTPNTYTITLHEQGATTHGSPSDGGEITVTYDANTNLGSIASLPERTGYTFNGYYDNAACTGSWIIKTDKYFNWDGTYINSSTGVWKYDGDVDLYAKWVANQYTVTLDVDEANKGTIAGATTSQDIYYDDATVTIPNRPTAANGYALDGYYTDHNGGGTKVINGDGTWIASVTGYTDGSKHWIHADDVTLYAYYKKAEITAITFDAAVVETKGTVSFAVTVSPTPTGDTKLCFTVLHSNDNPLAEQPTVTYSAGKYSFKAPEASGTYKVEAVLRTGTGCDGGTELDTEEASFQVAGIHTVTVRYKCGDDVIKAATTVTGRPLDWSDEITAPEIFGYTFSSWTAGDGVTLTDDNGTTTKTTTSSATIKIKAIYDGSLTANYTQNAIIYFKNTLGWSDVYVNFHTANAWNNTGNGSGSPKGVGNSGLTNRNKHMIQIGETDVWYYDYGYNDGGSSITPSLYVSFTNKSRDGVSEFWAENPGIDVVYPANYPDAISTDKSSENGFKAATPMFVPLESQEAKPINVGGGGKANYYNAGYWTKYTPGTGYTLEIYNSDGNVLLKSVEFTSEDDLMPMKAVVDLEAGQTYKYQLRRGGTDSNGIYYGNSGTMTYASHGDPTPWDMSNGSFSMCGITTNAAGDYTFNLSYSGHAAVNPHYRLRMAVDYPIASGDYRVIYYDNVKPYWKPSAIVPKVNNGKDTVSFFIRPGSTPYMKIQQSTVAGDGAITWNDFYSVPTATLTALAKDGVYNVCIAMNGSGGASVEKIESYTGNYYIRVDAANSKWDNYRSDPDHLMTYSEYSITHGGYSHYYCHWIDASDSRKNVKFCIANDYSPSISDTLIRENNVGDWANITYYIESNGDLKSNANVRFMWNQSTNVVSRAYVDGAQDDGSRFLVISSENGKIKQADGSALSNNEVTFSDNENWIYEANVKAQPKAAYKLISTWGETNTITQYFKGGSGVDETETLIDGSGTEWYDIRLLYDFKTNRLIASWVPSSGTITDDKAINADIMFIREHQGDIAQLTFGESGKISKIETAYGVIRFNKWTLANKSKEDGHAVLGDPKSIYERSLYWISFPFRVKLSEVMGFGSYGTHWAVQRYDGAGRAANGYWAESSSFWRWMNRNTEYLEPNQGYLLAIDVDLLGESSDVWGPESRSEQIEIYFPSYGTMPDITKATVTQTIPEHECTINWAADKGLPDTGDPRTSYNRTVFDSHWNVMSVPTYVNTNDVTFANTTWTGQIGPNFLYTWNADDHTITATSASGYTYHAMHAYMVQYGGNITWDANHVSSIVARKTYAESPSRVEFRLELQQNEKMIDRTYVALSNDEQTSAGFRFGEDMTKEFNANKSAIYTFIPNVATVAGNTLPMSDQTTIVPVGVTIKTAGDYTFAIPSGTEGIGVTLIDNETGVRTSLTALDYTVNLTAGKHDSRFVLEISPIQQMPTDIDQLPIINDQSSVKKVLIDGLLYIVKDGQLFDATGKVVTR